MSEPSRDRAIIDRLQVRYHTGGSADLARARLERIAQGTLRDACAAAISQVMDTLGEANSEAVIRIRSLQADFLWAVDDASDTAADVVLAERWASVIGEGLGRTITDGSPRDVVRFDSAAAYLAAFLADLAAGSACGRWYFAEYAHLCDLPVGTATAHLLAGRPALAGQVLIALQRNGHLDGMLARFTLEEAAALWSDALGFTAAALPDWHALPLDLLPALRDTLLPMGLTAVNLLAGSPSQRARSALRLYSAVIDRHPEWAARGDVAETIRAFLLLADALSALPAAWPAWLAAEDNPATDRLALSALHALTGERTAVAAWLAAAIAGGETPRRAVAAVAALAAELAPAPLARADNVDPATAPHDLPLTTAAAGLFLLVPSMLRLRLAHTLATVPAAGDDANKVNTLVYLLAAAIAGPEARHAGLLQDPGLAALAGLPAAPTPSALRPLTSDLWPLASGLRPPAADLAHLWLGDDLALDPAVATAISLIAVAVVREFASHLPGFADSSIPYLARNFLSASGTIRQTTNRIEVTLAPAPLAIVLHMAGMDGETGPVPWLGGRRLVIELD